MFYNTIKLASIDLQLAKDKCKSQEEFIKWLFNNQPDLQITPSQLLDLFDNNTPITSIRRALTNLTNDNFLQKTDVKVTGMYGKPEHIWKLYNIKTNTTFW
jgi:hypothetical protein